MMESTQRYAERNGNVELLNSIYMSIDSKIKYLNFYLYNTLFNQQPRPASSSEEGFQLQFNMSTPKEFFETYERITHDINLLFALRIICDSTNAVLVSELLSDDRYLAFDGSIELKEYIKSNEEANCRATS